MEPKSYFENEIRTKTNGHIPSGLLVDVISLCSTGVNFGIRGAAVVLILLKQILLHNKIITLQSQSMRMYQYFKLKTHNQQEWL